MKVLEGLDTASRRSVRDFCHDARQPIATLGALVGCLRSSSHDGELARRLVQIEGQLAELREMVDRVLLEEARPRWLDLGRELADVVDGIRLLHRGVVHLTAEPDVFVHADPLELRRIVRNLLDNASRARPDGCLDVELRQRADGCEIRIRNEGSSSVAGTGVGLGIGLAIVARLARAAGARVSVERSASGSLATVVVPRAHRLDRPRPA